MARVRANECHSVLFFERLEKSSRDSKILTDCSAESCGLDVQSSSLRPLRSLRFKQLRDRPQDSCLYRRPRQVHFSVINFSVHQTHEKHEKELAADRHNTDMSCFVFRVFRVPPSVAAAFCVSISWHSTLPQNAQGPHEALCGGEQNAAGHDQEENRGLLWE